MDNQKENARDKSGSENEITQGGIFADTALLFLIEEGIP